LEGCKKVQAEEVGANNLQKINYQDVVRGIQTTAIGGCARRTHHSIFNK
jgi:hypothetical protein